jgi:hypothetical protein
MIENTLTIIALLVIGCILVGAVVIALLAMWGHRD